METWPGFTSEDIRRIQPDIPLDGNKKCSRSVTNNQIRVSNGRQFFNKKDKVSESLTRRSSARNNPFHQSWDVLQEAKLSTGQINDNDVEKMEQCSSPEMSSDSSHSLENKNTLNDNPSKSSEPDVSNTVTILVNDDKSYEMISNAVPPSIIEESGYHGNSDPNGDASSSRHEQKAVVVLDRSRSQSREMTALEFFQEKQKVMEEQNKRKKELLTKAIADRKRQTQFEAKKVLQVQEELGRLDALLSTDVGILRNQIEVAAFEFNEAQKRYDKAESEFIEAKMHLFSRLERKELLTEHLCKIIEANELRKAKKLSELLAKLEVTDQNDKEYPSAGNGDFIFSGAPGLNEVSYAACTTLKNPLARNGNASLSEVKEPKPEKEFSKSETKKPDSGDGELKPGAGASSSVTNSSIKGALKEHGALQQINLVTAQSVNHRNECVPSYQNL